MTEGYKSIQGIVLGKIQKWRKCTLCKEVFHPSSKYSLFCEECKIHNDRYLYAEWMVDSSLTAY